MPLTALKPSQIRKIAANSLVGNATGAEARGTSLSVSQVRTLLGLGTTDSPTFNTVTATTSVLSPLFNNPNAAATTLGNSTYGVTVPGAATFSGTVTATSPAQFTSGFIARGAAIDLSWGGGIDFAANNGTVYGSIRSSNVAPGLIQTGTKFTGDVVFDATNTYDIGNGTYDPRTVRAATSVLTPLVSNTASQLTLTGGPDAGYFNIEGVILRTVSSATAYLRAGAGILNFHRAGLNPGYIVQLPNTNFEIVNQTTDGDINFLTYGSSGIVNIYNSTNNGILAVDTVRCSTVDKQTAALTLGNATYGVTVPGTMSIGRSPQAGVELDVYNASGAVEAQLVSGNSYAELVLASANTGIGCFITCASNLDFFIGGATRLSLNRSTGAATFSGDISMSKTSAQGYVRAYATDGVKNFAMYHDGTNGILSTSSGNLNLTPAGGTVAVTGGITASGNVSFTGGLSTGTVTKVAHYTTTADDYRVNVTANSVDITFETAVGCANREHEVVNSGSGVVTLKTTSAQTISGNASGALTLAQWKSIRVVSDGANWIIMSQIT